MKNLLVEYNPINKSNVFSSGDYISGRITLELMKQCKIESLYVKLKGKAKVSWTETYGKTVVTYSSKEKYFSMRQFVTQGEQDKNVIGQGCHTFPFNFQIPAGDLPSSFTGKYGKVKYTLEAVLSRSMKTDSKAKIPFTLINRDNLYNDPTLKTPQQSIVDKKMKVFTSGEVTMDVNIPQTGFCQDEGIKVMASIQNRSSREIKPKYCLYQKNSYFAKGKRKVETKDILKEVGEAIPSLAGQTVTRIISIPPTTSMSILNCKILRAEFRLRVYLDVKYATDPEVKFNIVILPTLERSDEGQPPPYNESEPYPNAFMSGGNSFLQNPTNLDPSAPPSYMTYGMYPSFSGHEGKS